MSFRTFEYDDIVWKQVVWDGLQWTKQLHTFIFSIISDALGREAGSVCQQDRQMFHHSSDRRKQVSSSLGRSGGPRKIGSEKVCTVRILWKGGGLVNSSYLGQSVTTAEQALWGKPKLSFQKTRCLLQRIVYNFHYWNSREDCGKATQYDPQGS